MTLYETLEWAKQNGELRIVERMRLYVLSATIREGIRLSEVTPETKCSPEYLQTVRKVVSELVGKPLPETRER